MGGAEARDRLTDRGPVLGERNRCAREQASEEYRKPPDMVERQRVEPPVPGPEGDVGVRAERIVVVVAEGVERRLRNAGTPRSEDYGRGTLQGDVLRLGALMALRE